MSDQSEQMAFPFPLNQAKLTEFLARWCAIEDEEDRLREVKRLLKEDFSTDFPMRGVLTAVKIVRARRKLAEHPTEGMRPEHLASLEALVEQCLIGTRQALDAMQAEIDERLAAGERAAVDMTTGEVRGGPHVADIRRTS